MERLWVGVNRFMHGMFKVTINIIGTPCLDMNIVFIKMRFLHQNEIPSSNNVMEPNRSSFWFEITIVM